MDSARQMAFLKAVTPQLKHFSTIWVSDPQGNWVSIADTTGSIADRDYYPKAKAGSTVISNPLLGRADGKLATVIAAPIRDASGQVVGILGGNVKMQVIQEMIGQMHIGETGYAYMIDSTGMITAHPDAAFILKENVQTMQDGALASIGKRMVAQEQGIDTYIFGGTEKSTAFAPVKAAGWSVAFSVPTAELLTALNGLIRTLVITAIVTLVLGLGVALVIPSQMIRPLNL